MQPIFLFEAGGTKTTLLIEQSGKITTSIMPGFNPNRYTADFENALHALSLPEPACVYFYGSGLSSETNKEIVRQIIVKKTGRPAQVFDDQLGAARATLGDQAGLVGILGTGAFAAWYDGKALHDRKGGHGYLIDDIGGGFELGKAILSAWLNADLPLNTDSDIARFIGISRNDFTTAFYKQPNLDLVASLPKLLLSHTEEPAIRKFLVRYFDLFFERHVSPILAIHPSTTMGLVGGIAEGFKEFIQVSAANAGITALKVISRPAEQLLAYHKRLS